MEQVDLAYLIGVIGPIVLLVIMIRFFEYLRDRSTHRSTVGNAGAKDKERGKEEPLRKERDRASNE